MVDAVRGPDARSGRRPGRHDKRAEILAAARHCFAEAGYDATTIRQIAARAGIDAALVHRRSGSKLDLFLAAVGLPEDLTELLATVLAGDRDGLVNGSYGHSSSCGTTPRFGAPRSPG